MDFNAMISLQKIWNEIRYAAMKWLWPPMKNFLVRSSPRWLVFIIDLIISAIAFWSAYFIRFNFSLQFDIHKAIYQFLLFLAINSVLFFVVKPYVGVVRMTGWKDIGKIFKVSTGLAVILFIITKLSRSGKIPLQFNYPYSIIFLAALFQALLMGGARMIYKAMYYKILRSGRKPVNILIYGTGPEAIEVADLLKSHPEYKYNIKGFVTRSPHSAKFIQGIPIIPLQDINETYLQQNAIDQVIITQSSSNPLNILELTDYFAAPSVKLHILPPSNEWMNNILRYEDIREFDLEALLERPPIRVNDRDILEAVRDKVIWITGGAGSIGSELARQILHYNPRKIYLLDQAETPLYELETELRPQFGDLFQTVLVDITDTSHIERLFRQYPPDIIFHAAAYKHVPVVELNPYYGIAVNILATKNLMEQAGENGVKKFIQISTDKAVNPTNVMGATKRVAELIARCMQEKYPQTQYIVTRFGNVLGSQGSVIHLFKKQIRQGGPVTVTHPDISRYFMTIPEAAHLVLKASRLGQGGQIYVFDMGQPVKIVELAKKMIRLSGKRYPDDIQIIYTGLRPGEKIYEELLTDSEKIESQVDEKLFISKLSPLDCDKLNEKLSALEKAFQALDMAQAVKLLKEILPEYKSNHSEFEKLD